MLNLMILVFVGGAVGATVREYIMLMTPHLADEFPLDILIANLVAAFLLGLVTALHKRSTVSDSVNTLVGTGIMGGLSTFSSFVYGAVVMMTTSNSAAGVALIYVLVSLLLGYVAVVVGIRLGGSRSII
jgi:fluoride exporter